MSNDAPAVILGAIAGAVVTASAGALALGLVSHAAWVATLGALAALAALVLFAGAVSS